MIHDSMKYNNFLDEYRNKVFNKEWVYIWDWLIKTWFNKGYIDESIDRNKKRKDLYQQMINKTIEQICKQWVSNILTTTNSIKKQITTGEDIIKAIKLLDWINNKTQVILLNTVLQKQFSDLICWDSVLPLKEELQSLMWIKIHLYENNNLFLLYSELLRKYDEIIYIPWLSNFYIINSKKILELINN